MPQELVWTTWGGGSEGRLANSQRARLAEVPALRRVQLADDPLDSPKNGTLDTHIRGPLRIGTVNAEPSIIRKSKCQCCSGCRARVGFGGKGWRTVQSLATNFWRRWQKEYRPQLIERRKWLSGKANLQPDDVVIIVTSNSPRGHWPLGRIVKPLPGPDGVVRTAIVKTADGEYVRPVAKLCLLERAKWRKVFVCLLWIFLSVFCLFVCLLCIFICVNRCNCLCIDIPKLTNGPGYRA